MQKTKRIEQQIKLTVKEKKREQKKFEKTVQDFMMKAAIKEGEDYFDHVIQSLKNKMEDVKRNKKHWKLAVTGKPHPNGYSPEKRIVIDQIEWNINAVQQINMYHEIGARAISKLTTAFKIQI